ncbi:hypothetical protein H6P81_018276 [Aristolochia fimbriata]|uniref:CDC20/Fizzy WD40 domain-containing protein n=1 Tax=Aristolochia fimbriata TaxID=158543 RepID=A0AAV7E4U0_ARIFI|nr:hypothetical protein H6P81_018276 [Aristolochia fimbriata]
MDEAQSHGQARHPLLLEYQYHVAPRPSYHRPTVGDRFIPVRSAMDFDFARSVLLESRKKKEEETLVSPHTEAYRKRLAETLNMNRTRILAFKTKPPTPVTSVFEETFWECEAAKPVRHIRTTCDRILDVPDLMNYYYLNLLDWSSSNVVAVGLGDTVLLWDVWSGSSSYLFTIDYDKGPLTSVSWAPDGQNIAVGLNNGEVHLWDAVAGKQLRTLKGGHRSRVGALSWNDHILTTGDMFGLIINHDARARKHILDVYRGHYLDVCGLKWSSSGKHLASGGKDKLLHIWDRSYASSSSSNSRTRRWLHRLEDHKGTVKALAWCPFQSNLLASGGGSGDGCIKFWNTQTGSCLNSVDSGSQVSSLLWSNKERELLSSQFKKLTLWRYPSMVKMAELTGHTSRVLFMAQSPDGCTVVSGAGDETLRFWNVFGTPQVAKKPAARTPNVGPCSYRSHVR